MTLPIILGREIGMVTDCSISIQTLTEQQLNTLIDRVDSDTYLIDGAKDDTFILYTNLDAPLMARW